MCVNCLSHSEVVVANLALAGAVLKDPAHRALAALGVVPEPDPVKRDVHTIAFLRELDLDPVEVLGLEVVALRRALGARRSAGAGHLPLAGTLLGLAHRLPQLAAAP